MADKRSTERGSQRRAGNDEALRGRVRPHDPFELIRWLALSQPDPRKALAELIQNSLDAGAQRVRVTRVRERGVPCLKIWDDGAGVIPEMTRPEALKHIATHIGHSRKRSLSPQERLQLMTQGQYGIGLLGFWSLGQKLEMRSSVPGQPPFRLVLHRDRPSYVIEKLRGRLDLDERFTEVVVVDLHREALAVLLARRAADYLASELRGQLLAREVALVIEDRMSRGRAPKEIEVRPRRFLGERVEGIGPIEVPGHAPIRFEIYVTGDEGGEGLSLYSAGTLVAESFRDLRALDLDRSPWTDERLTGFVDFPGLAIAPGSRRGVLLDATAALFAEALTQIAPVLEAVLDALERRRAEALDRSLIRDLQRAFRGFYRQRPNYAMLPVSRRADAADGPVEEGEARGGPALASPERGESRPRAPRALELLPPGPLHSLRVRPDPIRVAPGSVASARATALDATGRPIEDEVGFTAELAPGCGRVEVEEGRPGERAIARLRIEACAAETQGVLVVSAESEGREAKCDVEVVVIEDAEGAGSSGEGIPHPELVHQPGAGWRSRMLDGVWQVNSGHRDFRVVADRPAQKLRYLTLLFSKEVVLRSSRDPRLDGPLEQLVEVASYADGNLARGRPGKGTSGRGGEA